MRRKLAEISAENPAVELHDRGIDEVQAADLRARLKTFAEDWERPEAAIYVENLAGEVLAPWVRCICRKHSIQFFSSVGSDIGICRS